MKKLITVLALLLSVGSASAYQMVPSRQVFVEDFRITNTIVIGTNLLEVLQNLDLGIGDFVTNVAEDIVIDASTNYYPVTNPSNFVSDLTVTNIILGNPGEFVNTADVVNIIGVEVPIADLYPRDNPSNFLTAAEAPRGFIKGMVPQYEDTNTIRVSSGTITVSGTNTFFAPSETLVDVTALQASTASREIGYVYFDTSEAFNGSIDFYISGGEPAESSDGTGWNHPVTNDDRCVGSFRIEADAVGGDVLPFNVFGDGLTYRTALSSVPDGSPEVSLYQRVNAQTVFVAETWQEVTPSNLEILVPTHAFEVLVEWTTTFTNAVPPVAAADVGARVLLGTAATGANDGANFTGTGGAASAWRVREGDNMDGFSELDWVPVFTDKASRNVLFAAEEILFNTVSLGTRTWRITR